MLLCAGVGGVTSSDYCFIQSSLHHPGTALSIHSISDNATWHACVVRCFHGAPVRGAPLHLSLCEAQFVSVLSPRWSLCWVCMSGCYSSAGRTLSSEQ